MRERRMARLACVLALLACPAAAGASTLPPCKVGDVVRAGALNYDARILAHDAARGLYRVEFVTGSKGSQEWLPAPGLKTCAGEPAPPATESFFTATWRLWTGGGGAYVKKGSTYHATWLDTAKAPPLTVHKNGTYTWVIDTKRTITGKWRVARPNELKYGYDKRGLALLLEQGADGADWLVTRDLAYSTRGHDAILIEHAKIGLTYVGYKQ